MTSVPTAEGGCLKGFAGTVLAHRTRRNAEDGVPYDCSKIGNKHTPCGAVKIPLDKGLASCYPIFNK